MSLQSRRLALQAQLEGILGSRNVYFQPPASIFIKYPCIVYSFDGEEVRHSNNLTYIKRYKFDMTFITKDAEPSDTLSALDSIPYCKLERVYQSDNLHHFSYKLVVLEEGTNNV